MSETDSSMRFNNIVTVAEESFALLVLENNFEKWCHIAAEKEGRPPQPIYMKKVYVRSSSRNCAGDWIDEGLKRYNKIIELVERNREDTHTSFFMGDVKKMYEDELRNISSGRKRRSRDDDDDEITRPKDKQRVVVRNLLKR